MARTKSQLGVVVTISLFLVLVSRPSTYALLRDLPGMWRLQYIRAYLAPPAYERVDYHLPELVNISQLLDTIAEPLALVASPRMQSGDHIMVIQYLTKPRVRSGMYANSQGPENGHSTADPLRVLLVASNESLPNVLNTIPATVRTLLVARSDERDCLRAFSCCGDVQIKLSTEHFSLAELIRKPQD